VKTVGLIVPCRNESGHIAAFCAAVFRQRLPEGWRLELVVADGRSDDGTRERLAAIASTQPRLVVIDNPGRIVSTGLNLAIAATTGEVVVRMDVHTDYADDYVAKCLEALAATGADNVGGPWHAQPAPDATPMQQAVAAAFQSRWVAGGARSRDLAYSGWVDTVYLGAWPRASLQRFGGFDETLVRNQDDEFNLRITRAGGRVWQSADIRSVYRPRSRLGQVFRQYLQYGYWKPFVMKKHGQAASARQLMPGLLVAGLAVTWAVAFAGWAWLHATGAGSVVAASAPFSGASAFTAPAGSAASSASAAIAGAPSALGFVWPAIALTSLYALGVVGMTLLAGTGHPVRVILRLPAVIAAYHVGYGIGFLAGAWDALRGKPGRDRFARLTR
jgi:glycosyltransferase involved in cell wall biosynthesis